MNHTLEADGIQLEYNGRKILSDIYLLSQTGKITGLLGRNGEGKSCLMKIIFGSLKAERSVRIDKRSQNEPFKRPGLLVYLPQFNFIPPSLSIKTVFQHFDIQYDAFENRFPAFSGKHKYGIGRLSGGERRLVELNVVIKTAALFVLLDEPFTHLNPVQIESVKELLEEEKIHKGFVITDHLYRHVTAICDSFYILLDGKTHLAKSLADVERLGYARL